jgi:hypothetical protein
MENNNYLRTTEQTLNYLKTNGVEVHHVEHHEKLETVQQGLEKFKVVEFKSGTFVFVKNLFMKNKAGGLYLFTVHPVRKSNLKINNINIV